VSVKAFLLIGLSIRMDPLTLNFMIQEGKEAWRRTRAANEVSQPYPTNPLLSIVNRSEWFSFSLRVFLLGRSSSHVGNGFAYESKEVWHGQV